MTEFATLTFTRKAAAAPGVLWHIWADPAARALWSAPSPAVTVEFLEADTREGGREVSLCKVAGQPDIRCEVAWLQVESGRRSVNSEVIQSGGAIRSVSLVTAEIAAEGDGARIDVTVQLSSLHADMAAGYRAGFDAGLGNIAEVAARTLQIERVIRAPRARVWATWLNPATLPLWWGPEGFSCRTSRIDLRAGGEWVFDMIGPDGTVWPNHHRYREMQEGRRLSYTLLRGENGPRHADAWVNFEDHAEGTRVTLSMAMETAEEYRTAKGFGAEELGQQTLSKLERMIPAA